MDRLDLLKELEKLVILRRLDTDEIRLYLLLLANCSGSRDGEIEYMSIKSAFGGVFSRSKLEKACRRLFNYKLITLTSIIPIGKSEVDFTLSYIISPARVN
jgi:hypothetical protein